MILSNGVDPLIEIVAIGLVAIVFTRAIGEKAAHYAIYTATLRDYRLAPPIACFSAGRRPACGGSYCSRPAALARDPRIRRAFRNRPARPVLRCDVACASGGRTEIECGCGGRGTASLLAAGRA